MVAYWIFEPIEHGVTGLNAERQNLELEAQMARQQKLAADLTRHGYKGAAAEALIRLRILQARQERTAAVP